MKQAEDVWPGPWWLRPLFYLLISTINSSTTPKTERKTALFYVLSLKKKLPLGESESVSPQEIDEINILNASFLAMHRAIKTQQKPEQLLIDGNRFNPYKDIPHHCIVKGDGKFLSIAAASILAKTYRDDIMEKLDLEFDHTLGKTTKATLLPPSESYSKKNTPHHRKSFQLLPSQLKLDF